MDQKTMGRVTSAARQWWLKVNTKPVRLHALDGATFPYIIKVEYIVDGEIHVKRKWIPAGKPVPQVGSTVEVMYDSQKPSRAKIW